MEALLSEPGSEWQFKHYFLSCSNFITWIGKMGHITVILVFLLHGLCHRALGNSSVIWLYNPQPSRPSLSKSLSYFSFWPHGLCSPFTYCYMMIS